MSVFKDKDDLLAQAFKNNISDDDSSDERSSLPKDQVPDSQATIGSVKELESEITVLDGPEDYIEETKSEKSRQIVVDFSLESSQVITISDDDDEDDKNVNDLARIGSDQRVGDESLVVSDVSSPNPYRLSLDEDHHFNLKLTLAGEYKQYPSTYRTPLNQILKDLITELRSQNKALVVMNAGHQVPLDETPYALKLTPGTILRAIEISNSGPTTSTCQDPDELSLKLQDGQRKHLKEFRILKHEPIGKLKTAYAEAFKYNNPDAIRLQFDGDILDDESTPDELDMDDGCMIDVLVSNNVT